MATILIPQFAYRIAVLHNDPYHLLKKQAGRYHHTCCDRIMQQDEMVSELISYLHLDQLCETCLTNAGLIAVESTTAK